MTTRVVHCSTFSLLIGLAFCAAFSVAAANDSGKGQAGTGAPIQARALDTNCIALSSWNETFCDNPALATFYVAHDGRLILAIESELGMTCLETWRSETVKTITLSEGSRSICVETTDNDVLVEISDPDATRFEPFATNSCVTFDFDPGEKEPLHRVARQLELLTGKTAAVTDLVPSAIRRKAASFKEQMQKHARTAAAKAAASQKASSKSQAGEGVKGRLKAIRAKDTLLASWNYDDPEAGTIPCNFLQPADGSLMLICGEVDVYSWRSESINAVTLYDEDNEICVETAEGAVQEKTGSGLVGTNSSVWMYFNPTDKEKLRQVARQLELLAGQPLAAENIVPAAKKEKAAAFKGQIQKQARAAAKRASASPGVSKKYAKHSVADVKSRVKAIRAKYTFLTDWSYDDGLGPVPCDFFQADDGFLYLTCDLYGEDPSVFVWQSEAVAAITLYEGDNEICVETAAGAVSEETGDGLLTYDSVWMFFDSNDKDTLHKVARQLEAITGKTVSAESAVPFAKKQKAAEVRGKIKKHTQAVAGKTPASKNVSKQGPGKSAGVAQSRLKAIRAKSTLFAEWVFDDGLYVYSYSFYQADDGCLCLWDGFFERSWRSEDVKAITLYERDCWIWVDTAEGAVWEYDWLYDLEGWDDFVCFEFDSSDKETLYSVAQQLELLTGKTAIISDTATLAVKQKAAAFKTKARQHAQTAASRKPAPQKVSPEGKSQPGSSVKSRIKSLKTSNTLVAGWKRGTGYYATSFALYQTNGGQMFLSEQFSADVYLFTWKMDAVSAITVYEGENEVCVETAEDSVLAEFGSESGVIGGPACATSFVWLDFDPGDKETLHKIAHQLEVIAGRKASTEDTVPYAKKQKRSALKAKLREGGAPQ